MEATIHTDNTDPQARPKEPPQGIPGWGADLDPARRPAVPMARTPPRLEHEPPPLTHQTNRGLVKVFHSTERPGLTPVYGTSTPPSGFSGLIRGAAFRYSENDLRHWLMLLFADRVNVVEGILDDLAHGHVPNVFAEMGARAEWRHNRAGFVRKALIASAAIGLAVYLVQRRRR